MTKKNILASWAKTGLLPFNPSRVLRDIVKLDAPLTIQVPEVQSTQNGVIQTPVTPVSSEAVTQLLSLIKQDSHSNKPNKMRHHKLIQKLPTPPKDLLRNKSDILKKPGKNGEGQVMIQEDLEAIRADRAERVKQDAAKKAVSKAKRGRPKATTQADGGEEGKKRGRKRKRVAAEEGVPDEQEVGVSGPSTKAARASDALIDPMPETWRAPMDMSMTETFCCDAPCYLECILRIAQLHYNSSVTEEVQYGVMVWPASQDTFPLALDYRSLLRAKIVVLNMKEDIALEHAAKKAGRILLEWISSSDYPAQQSDIIKRRQEGTGQWFLDAPEVARWLDDAKTTLFYPGILGAGKTMVAAIAVDQLLDSAQNDAYEDIVSILAAILKQLVQSRPSTLGPVEKLHQKHAGRGTKPSLDDIYSALRDMLAQYPYVHIVCGTAATAAAAATMVPQHVFEFLDLSFELN
ncbi:uncharacterized protein BDR25DRAFT_357539 [Lindgomyces ingoldianus]|uniref:Uncharacterized protein n=1 Tax=Lindgomyces ingoldianus TaxID=673940 RepID=A0ACB6QQP9_9PLEO|nr:uncharacterized protein BDR25DRAFT_357539 [Lindgomyces ingoldianus]KAF2468612.1 hypothetical protein BDR25DRAFT_357539 [Lindgomyces ingoldianus]